MSHLSMVRRTLGAVRRLPVEPFVEGFDITAHDGESNGVGASATPGVRVAVNRDRNPCPCSIRVPFVGLAHRAVRAVRGNTSKPTPSSAGDNDTSAADGSYRLRTCVLGDLQLFDPRHLSASNRRAAACARAASTRRSRSRSRFRRRTTKATRADQTASPKTPYVIAPGSPLDRNNGAAINEMSATAPNDNTEDRYDRLRRYEHSNTEWHSPSLLHRAEPRMRAPLRLRSPERSALPRPSCRVRH
jgi:hypothetical protein